VAIQVIYFARLCLFRIRAISDWLIPSGEASALGSGPHIGIALNSPHRSDSVYITHCVVMVCGHCCAIFRKSPAILNWWIPSLQPLALDSGPPEEIGIGLNPPHRSDSVYITHSVVMVCGHCCAIFRKSLAILN
jgi:hypothetical protein